jgi:TPR repeat protein
MGFVLRTARVCLRTKRRLPGYKLAADQNLAAAQFAYAVCLAKGEGVEVGLAEAAEYYRRAADQNHVGAMNNYGVCLAEGSGVGKNWPEAVRYFKMAADLNDPTAQCNYAVHLKEGTAVDKDDAEAVRYYKLSAAQDFAPAMFNLAIALDSGRGTDVDMEEAARYYRLAADQNLPGAQNNFGVCLARGNGVPADLVEAVRYYRLAADQGNIVAQFNLAVCLLTGHGVQQHDAQAATYFKLAADGGDADTHRALAKFLAASRCLPKVSQEALRLSTISESAPDQVNTEADRIREVPDDSQPQPPSPEPTPSSPEQSPPSPAPSSPRRAAQSAEASASSCEGGRLSKWVMDFRNMIQIKELGSGGFGSVSLVEDPETHSQIALKSFYAKNSSETDLTELFTREVELLIELAHPCVVPIIGYSLPSGEAPAQIATKFAANGSLRDAIKKWQAGSAPEFMDETGVAMILIGIILGMKFFHSRGVLHRDLKPENILLDDNGRPQIADLGSSRFIEMDVTLTRQVGTPLYMAPELYEIGIYTPAVDAYSFALILYELVVGRPVFDRKIGPLVLMRQVAGTERPALPDAMDLTVKKAIARGWSPDPMLRESFDETFANFKRIHYKITPGVDAARVAQFVAAVRAVEPK